MVVFRENNSMSKCLSLCLKFNLYVGSRLCLIVRQIFNFVIWILDKFRLLPFSYLEIKHYCIPGDPSSSTSFGIIVFWIFFYWNWWSINNSLLCNCVILFQFLRRNLFPLFIKQIKCYFHTAIVPLISLKISQELK